MIKKLTIIIMIILFAGILVACDNNATPKIGDQTFEEIFEEIKPVSETSSNLELITQSTKYPDATITWRSSQMSIITNQGEVRRPDENTSVEMIATVTLEGIFKTKRFPVNVLSVDSVIFDLNAYKSDYGFASLAISNRASLAEQVVEVSTPVEFLDAMANKSIKVIKITNDLNMGYENVVKQLLLEGKTQEEIDSHYTNGSFYRMNANVPSLHPTLIKEGVGQLIIQDRNEGLMIYSENGAKISHLTTIIKTSKDIVIRNLHLTGIWEWDDDMAANYDDQDWDYFTIETTNGVWLDHLKFDQSYDGLVDVKGGTSNFTISYLDLNFQVNDFIREQINYLEENYMSNENKTSANSRYVRLREYLNPEQIMEYTSMQKKGFNLGNTTMGLGFDTITVTIHHSRFINLADRLPRLRQGDVHVYNVLQDNTGLERVRGLISGTGMSLPNQGMVPTEEAAILYENNKLINVAEPIKTHQDSNTDPKYTGRYKVENSILINGSNYYLGSSNEGEQGDDPFTPWRQSNSNMPRIPFFFRNYQEVPYQYKGNPDLNYFVSPESIGKVLNDNYVGPGEIPGLNWLEIRRILSNPISPVAVRGHKIDPASIIIEDDLIEINQEFTPQNPRVTNFYKGGTQYVLDRDYTLSIDTSNLNNQVEGEYKVIYTFKNTHNDWDEFIWEQNVLVYDANKANEIYRYNASREFNGMINIDYSVYKNSGTIYYLFSDNPNLNISDLKASNNLNSAVIENVNGRLNNLSTSRLPYIYLFTQREDLTSEVIRIDIINEVIIEISTVNQLNAMITSFDSIGKYYILVNDIDISTGRLDQLSTANVFGGVFDGNGYTLKNYSAQVLRGGLFMTINGGMIKNLTLDNINYNVTSLYQPSSDDPNVMVETKPSDDAGILATYVYGSAIFENITIKNSSLTTVKNYAGTLLGRIRTGEATFNNIKVLNVDINATVTAAKYTGGLIGGIETNTKLYMNDIYVNGLDIKHTQSDMIGVVVGRIRSHAEFNRVVLLDVNVTGRHNLGILIGKEDNTTTSVTASNLLADVSFEFQPDVSGVYSDYYGYVVGNADAGKVVVSNYYVVESPNFINSKGLNSQTGFIVLSELNQTWFEANLGSIVNSQLWTIESNMLKLN
ncbi:immunoglobulin-like domain-containing protein [Acholeplasma granularum]|uniref:immunoglobulin-like domain-containing protein n=1 Tax=Acholeplasma granularum TaxID=264635 RepID=UPI000472ECBA|nr:immunoglobulin-like domain-containing protein [Acholeplasma granularum]